jgi:hypothetical protein
MTYVVAQYLWQLVRGDDSARDFIYKDAAGTVINLTGYTASLEVTRAGVISNITGTIDGPNGKISITIPNATTATWSSNPSYKLRIISGGSIKTTILAGDFEVEQ